MEWKEVTLGEIGTIVGGATPSTKNTSFYDGNIPWLTPKDLSVNGNKYIFRGERNITEAGFKSCSCKMLPKGSVLFSSRAPIGYVAIAANDMCTNQGFKSVIPNEETDSEFLYYLLKYNKDNIASQGSGTTFAEVSGKTMKDIEVVVPKEKEDQRRIASILSSLDRKIELNNKINADLEEMAQAIFKNWFVDFEPFKDGKFVDSELGMIPEGWKVGTLGDITKNKSAKVKERNDVKVLSPVTTGELVLSEEYFTKQVFSSSIAKYKIVNKGDFAYNPARVNIGSLGRNEFDFDGCVSPVYVVFSVLDGYENYFDLFRKTDFFKDSVASLAIGGVRQSLSYDDLSSIEVIIPSENAVEEFNNLYNQMKKTIKANKLESSRLSSLRDTLLPRLMSGELEVPE
ncbi:restriction endonuclease subunit S [Segatella copri]|uniref:restriction endonuclease subunit S n=1 Tax=Segatella copri TaxID=165179 RepID=UPI002916A529|nr:restriction endonuclease subunit S [Segatella copri]MDV3121206.1 restriction endonuclease subunit S [Segatella copri]